MNNTGNEEYMNRSVSTVLRIGFVALLIVLSYWILKPFLIPVLWGIIVATGIYPVHVKLSAVFGDRKKLSAIVLTLLAIALLVVPSIFFTNSTIDTVKELVADIEAGTLAIPPPPSNVAEWPLVGGSVYSIWETSYENIESLLIRFEPQLKTYVPRLLTSAANLGGAILLFLISLIISGALLINAEAAEKVAISVFKGLAGERGEEFVSLGGKTIRSVVQGVLGVALLQTFFLSVGLFVIGFPAAGVISLIILIASIIQLPTALITIPVIIYTFSFADTTPAILFLIWTVIWSLSDNVLKPILFGKGVNIPMLIVLLGAIGGMMFGGIIGLFVGPVILAFAYKIFGAMLEI